MARNLAIKHIRTTRANLDSQAGSSGLNQGEIYLITDEDRIAIGLSATTYETYGKLSEINALPVTVTGTCTTARTTAAKTVTIADYTLRAKDTLAITFTDGFSVNNATLNVNGGGAINIRVGAVNVTTALVSVAAATSFTVNLYYDGTYFYFPGSQLNTNTTYTEISEAEIDAGTASTARSISGRRSEYIVAKARSNVLQLDNTTAFTPTADYHPATKKYVDDNAAAPDYTLATLAWADVSTEASTMYSSMQQVTGINVPTPIIITFTNNFGYFYVYCNTSNSFSGAIQLNTATNGGGPIYIELLPNLYYGFKYINMYAGATETVTIKSSSDLTNIDTITFTYPGGGPP